MHVVDVETYLRCRAEDVLTERADDGFDPDGELAIRATALCAAGALDEPRAAGVLESYASAAAVRGRGHHRRHHLGRRPRSAGASPLPSMRWASVRRAVELSSGKLQVRTIVVTDGVIRLSGTIRFAPPAPSQSGAPGAAPARPARISSPMRLAGPYPPYAGPSTLQLTDDRGKSASAHFSGSGSQQESSGRWTADQPLAPDTAYLLIDGVRVDLVDMPVAVTRARPVTEADPAVHHIHQTLLRQAQVGYSGAAASPLGWVLDTYLAIGLLAPDDPVISQARTTAAAIAAVTDGAVLPKSAAAELDQPWRSAFARLRARSRRHGSCPVGAQVEVGDAVVMVHGAEVTDSAILVDFEAYRPTGLDDRAPLPVSVRAVDDGGNHYLSRLADWETMDEGWFAGRVELWPALAEAARELHLVLGGDRSEVTVSVELGGLSS